MLMKTGGIGRAYFIAAMAVVLGIVSGCTERTQGYEGNEVRATDTVYPYRQYSPYASALKRCVLVSTVADSCNVSEMPFIGDGKNTPTVDQVMDRLLVTHNWMGRRFENALRNAPDDTLLLLFSSATSILIGSEVRPSFYVPLTGGIQLDAAYLWTTVDEKVSVSQQEDYRAGFGSTFQFLEIGSSRNAKGERIAGFYSLSDDSVRPVKDMEFYLYSLLFHELAHATDFMPRHKIGELNANVSLYEAIGDISADWLSTSLNATNPRTSAELIAVADVRYDGVAATDEQKALTATDMGALIGSDGAVKLYSYYSQYEDLAQLTEEALLGQLFGVRLNYAFMQKPADEDAPCEDYVVSWGQRNRLADPLVNVRARVAVGLVLDDASKIETFMDNELGSAESMTVGMDWCENQKPAGAIAATTEVRSASVQNEPTNGSLFREMLELDNVIHPPGLHQR